MVVSTVMNANYLPSYQPYVLNLTEAFDSAGSALFFATTTPLYDTCFKAHTDKDQIKNCYKKTMAVYNIIID